MEFFQERSVSLGGDKVVDHVYGRSKEDLDVGIAGGTGEAFGQEALSSAGVSDEDHIHVLSNKLETQQIEDTSFLILS